jgi:hypothetical protein
LIFTINKLSPSYNLLFFSCMQALAVVNDIEKSVFDLFGDSINNKHEEIQRKFNSLRDMIG